MPCILTNGVEKNKMVFCYLYGPFHAEWRFPNDWTEAAKKGHFEGLDFGEKL